MSWDEPHESQLCTHRASAFASGWENQQTRANIPNIEYAYKLRGLLKLPLIYFA